MLPIQRAPAIHAGLLPALTVPVDALLARASRRSTDPLLELQQLGYLPIGTDAAAWEELGDADWYALLRAIARRCPRLAITLAAARLTLDITGEVLAPEAMRARASAAVTAMACERTPVLRVAAELLATLEAPGAETPRISADIVVPPATQLRLPRDLLAIANGALWRLWNTCAQHAESRPMFRRVLADFPAVRYRLLCALIVVLAAEEHAERAAGDPGEGASLAAFRTACLQVRTETQQLCGGSGFMRESDYGATLVDVDHCLRALSFLPAAVHDDREPAHAVVRRRLGEGDIALSEWAALVPLALHKHGG